MLPSRNLKKKSVNIAERRLLCNMAPFSTAAHLPFSVSVVMARNVKIDF